MILMKFKLHTEFLWFIFSAAFIFTQSCLIAEYTDSKSESLYNLHLIISKTLKFTVNLC
jgi:hypothetical protein